MSSLAFLWPMAACALMGLALYVTRGVLDQTVTPGGVIRFAMLPPWQALAGFLCLAGLVLVFIDHLNAPRGTTSGKRPRLRELVVPLCALAVLLLPFVPWLPDRWPALQALAGPLRAVIWLAVAALQVWVLWQSRALTARLIERWPVAALGVAVFIASAAVAGAGAARLTGTPLFPSGDEPHYLVVAQSLWRDGDLKIENNHARGDYREYYREDLDPHYLTRGRDGEIYSIHPVGLSVLLAPIYAAGGYVAVVWTLMAMGAATLLLAWRWVIGTLNAAGPATFAWAAIALTAPFLFNTFTVYPEITAGLAVMIAFLAALRTSPVDSSLARWCAIGIAVAVLPWLSTKYAPMSAALLFIVLLRLAEKEPAPLLRHAKALAVMAIYAISLAGWFAFFHTIWGSPLPMAPYGALVQTSPLNLRFGAPGLLFDQEYGLLAFAPVYVLAATGLYRLWSAGGELRRQSLEITAIFGALLATVGAFGIWWGGTAAPARPLASGLPLLALPIAAAFRASPAGSASRAAQHLLLWVSIGIAITLAVAQDGLLINNGRDGSSSLLEYWLPRWELWSLAPTFIGQPWRIAWGQTLLWLTVAGLAAITLRRLRCQTAGTAALAAVATMVTALMVVTVAMPWLPIGRPVPLVDLSARSRLAALDGFDARVRPAAIFYDPLRKTASVDLVPQLTLGVRAGQRHDPQPVRVIHNGRFSLPAGQYGVAVHFGDRVADRPLTLSLQIGRNGPPVSSWDLQPQAGARWTTTVWLPVDASFVGLRGPVEMERQITAITITPTAIVDAGARPHVPVVLAAAAYQGASVYFHDEQLYPERGGFWTIGGQTARVTVASPSDRTAPVRLRMHSGSHRNTVILSTFGWDREIALVPGQHVEVELPVVAGNVIPLLITAHDGFSPKATDPTSTDGRFLGVWVEVMDTP